MVRAHRSGRLKNIIHQNLTMNYKKFTLWIFVLLMLIVAAMFAFPNSITIGLGVIAIPVLVAVQAFIILRAKEESPQTFEDEWYDNT